MQIEREQLSDLALAGKNVFEKHKCSRCHAHGQKAPDLASPFLANNEFLVRVHLESLEQTAMPPIDLTPEEIRLVSHYVAALHAAQQSHVHEAQANATCPVCLSPVLIQNARARNLEIHYLGEDYFFECHDCLEAFKQVPEAFVRY